MYITRIFNARMITLAVLTLVFASVAYGFAAANTVPASNAGDGQNTISGYTVSNVKYTLNTTNPANIDAVSFDLAGSANKPATVKAKLETSGSSWYSCTSASTTSPFAYTCATTSPQATALGANELRVVAAD